MKLKILYNPICTVLFTLLIVSCNDTQKNEVGYTTIEKWQDGKRAAVSLTYDGGTSNQFKVALPIMNRLELPATFFIVTGEVEGSEYERRFLGRPLDEIVNETEEIKTNSENFFERASAIRVLGDESIIEFHTRAGDLWEVGKFEEAHLQIDEAYTLVRQTPTPHIVNKNQQKSGATWEELKAYASLGYEFASHSVSHAQFGILDDVNLIYELEKSKEEIEVHLGPQHTFSVECPYGTENERVMEFTLARYEVTRNRMPEPFLEEINRWNKMPPGASVKEYVQWQRGPKSATPVEEMISWIDICLVNDNNWLVLVFHGIEGIGWEPIRADIISSYFEYIKSNEKDLWVATFKDVTRYIRERMNAEIVYSKNEDQITVQLNHDLDPLLYDLPLTLKTYIPANWNSVECRQGENTQILIPGNDENGYFVQYRAMANMEDIILVN